MRVKTETKPSFSLVYTCTFIAFPATFSRGLLVKWGILGDQEARRRGGNDLSCVVLAEISQSNP